MRTPNKGHANKLCHMTHLPYIYLWNDRLFMKVVVAISIFNHVKTGLKMGLTLKEKNIVMLCRHQSTYLNILKFES